MQYSNNEPRGNTVNYPKLAVVTTSSSAPKNFAYEGESFVISTPSSPENTSLFYNEVLHEIIDQYDVFAFLEKEDDFTFLESCNMIVNRLFKNDMVGSVYSDCLSANGKDSFSVFVPTFSHDNYLGNNKIFHQPIFAKRDALKYGAAHLSKVSCFLDQPPQYFDSRLKRLCFHGLLGVLSGGWVVSHIAEPLFTCQNKNFDIENSNSDLNILFNR